jgi:hypothetical protein
MDPVKTTAFVIGLCIAAVGAIGILAPSSLVWISQRFGTPAEWYAIGVTRVAIGLLLLAVARTSRAPRALRVIAFIPLLAGVGALATPSIGLERARAIIEWWSRQGPGVLRLPAVFLVALGGFIAYACRPSPRAA